MKNFPDELRHGSGAIMTLDPTRLLLAFKKALGREEIEACLRDFGLVLEDSGQEKTDRPFEFVNHTDQRFWVRSQTNRPIDQQLFEALQNGLAETLDWLGPVYRLGDSKGRDGLLCPLPNVLLIRPIPKLTKRQQKSLEDKLRTYGLKEVPKKSAYMGDYRYYVIADIRERTAYQLMDILLQQEQELIIEVKFENMPITVPMMTIPNDTYFPRQWGMTRIQAGGEGITGWDLSTGAEVIVCVMDSGCDLDHPDLSFVNDGINLGTMMPPALPTPAFSGNGRRAHGTCVAGMVAGRYNNMVGVAGVAGNCRILPLAIENSTDGEIYGGINYAADHGAHVICICYGRYEGEGWDFRLIGEAVTHAVNDRHCVIVSPTGNEDRGDVNRYPARDPLVMAVGGSDQRDNRKSPASPDGEGWGANYGPGISVVAPAVLNPTTDIRGDAGLNANNGGPFTWPGITSPTYPTCGDEAGDYFFLFTATSSAAPQVAGLAAALRSRYPLLSPSDVRDIIERTAEKVGGTYADVPDFLNGTRNREMGYGRINMFRALDFGDMMIKDWPGDRGTEPSTPPGGNFWSFSDIVVTSSDEARFIPDDPSQSSNVTRGLTNYLKIRVTNHGPNEARNVVVNARIVPYVGLEFVYPADWTSIDATHIRPAPLRSRIASIRPNGSEIARFTISREQVDTLWGWVSGREWHPCLLASVNSDNDYAFATASITGDRLVMRRNNLAQKNLSVINMGMRKSAQGSSLRRGRQFPFLAGNLFNAEPAMQILVDRSRLPKTMPLLLALDEDGQAFPLVDLKPVITREKPVGGGISPGRAKIGKVSVKGGKVIVRGGRRFVEVQEAIAIISMEKQANRLYPLSLRCTIPAAARLGDSYVINVAQRNEREETVGGATVIYQVK